MSEVVRILLIEGAATKRLRHSGVPMAYVDARREVRFAVESFPSIAIIGIGSGPTANYALFHLLRLGVRAHITVFERSAELGKGFPYRESTTTRSMLANIASIEIPPLHETLLDWLRACDDAALRSYGLVRSELADRTVPSRRAIGDYFATQLSKSVAKATHAGLRVEILSSTSVDDIRPNGRSLQVVTDRFSQTFTCVIVATGHPALVEGNDPHFFQSPYGRLLQASR